MSGENRNVGLGPYAAAGASSPARAVMAKLLEKARIRAALSAIQADLNSSIVALDRSQLAELKLLMSAHVEMLEDAEDEDRRVIAEEQELSKTTKTASVIVPRAAVQALAREAEKRIQRGNFPTTSGLIQEAVGALSANYLESPIIKPKLPGGFQLFGQTKTRESQ